MLLQEIFDKAAIHLLTQMKPAIIYNEQQAPICMYKDPSGLKCAVGAFIPDELYKYSLENKTVKSQALLDVLVAAKVVDDVYCITKPDCVRVEMSSISNTDALVKRKLWTDSVPCSLLSDLQELHDNSKPVHWLSGLYYIATEFGLSKEKLPAFPA